KKAVRGTNGPSLGRKRPRRAAADEQGSLMPQCKIDVAAHKLQLHFLQSWSAMSGKLTEFGVILAFAPAFTRLQISTGAAAKSAG
ncbi:MAG: hypothetical protein KJ587_12325, partial [Alphaproteobacteria bacterium]|nr:hypothetical protein [Alphaproteobacteria bacterium]